MKSSKSSSLSLLSTVLVGALGLLFIVSFFVFYIVEGERGLVQRFGQINTYNDGTPVVYEPGLHFYLPMIDQLRRITVKKQILSVPSDRIYTSEQKTVTVDYYALWRVSDVKSFYLRTNGDYERAKVFLRGKINDALRVEVGKREINDVITGQRGDIIDTLKKKSMVAAENLGIEIMDVRIIKVDYPAEVSDSVFQRMRAAREKEAGMYRSEGDEESEIIRAKGDAERLTLLAKANEHAAKIRASGDALAAQVYSKAFSQSLKFYDILRSLGLYEQVVKDNETMVVNLESMKPFAPINNGGFSLKQHVQTTTTP